VDGKLTQSSDGLGAMSGVSIGAGFWLGGEPFRGYVLRAIYTYYSYSFDTTFSTGTVHVDFTERRFFGMLGSYSRFGAFTIGGGIGLGVELNKKDRCIVGPDDCGELQISLGDNRVIDLHDFFYPVVLEGRISLGVSF
jgi:hypothetical protein